MRFFDARQEIPRVDVAQVVRKPVPTLDDDQSLWVWAEDAIRTGLYTLSHARDIFTANPEFTDWYNARAMARNLNDG